MKYHHPRNWLVEGQQCGLTGLRHASGDHCSSALRELRQRNLDAMQVETRGHTRLSGLRVLYFGMFGQLSYRPLAMLLEAGVNICGVVVPAAAGPASAPPILRRAPAQQQMLIPLHSASTQQTIVQLAWAREVPVFELHQPGHPETLAILRQQQPDLVCVSCFSRRLPASLLTLPPHGVLNVHPSLLPAYRGPAPLFWLFHSGERRTGVTIHFMDEGLDSGDIALQASLELPIGCSTAEAEHRCAELGGQLLVEAIRALENGTLERHSQPAGGSYDSWPEPDDFRLDIRWPAERAYTFMRGTSAWGQPYLVDVAGERLALRDAITYQALAVQDVPYRREGREVAIQFSPGILRAVLSEPSAEAAQQ